MEFIQAIGLLITLATLLGGAYVGVRKIGPGNAQSISEAAGQVSKAAVEFMQIQRNRIEQQDGEIDGLKERMSVMEAKLNAYQGIEEKLRAVEAQRDAAERAAEHLLDRIGELVDVLHANQVEPPPEVLKVVLANRRKNGGTS